MKEVEATLTTAIRAGADLPVNGGKKPDVRELIDFWKRNKYPLLALDRADGLGELLDTPEFNRAREKEAGIWGSLRAEYILVRERWARKGIECILIKSGGMAPSFPYLSDNLDVLVREENEAKARQILREMGYIELRNIEEPQKFLFRKFSGGESISAIHLHTRVGWLVGFMDEDSLWQRACLSPDDEAVTIPSPEDTILITLAHGFYENKRFRLGDIDRVRHCWQRGGIDWDYMERVAGQRGWLDGLHFCLLTVAHLEKRLWGKTSIPRHVLAGWKTSLKRHHYIYSYYRKIVRRAPITLPFTFSFLFSKILYYKKIWLDRDESLGTRLFNIIQTLTIGLKLKSRIRPRPSLLVSFSGPDGSGKTQLAEALAQALTTSELKPKYYWKRCGTSFSAKLFSALGKLFLGRKSQTADTIPGAAGRKERLQNPFYRLVWSYLNAADMVLSYFFQVSLSRLVGRIIICDRYVYDAAAEMACSLPPRDKVNRFAIKLILALTPKPDVAYFLDIPGDVCAQRKSDNIEPSYLRRQRTVYLALAAWYRMRIKNTTQEFRVNADEICNEVMTPYLDNFETWLNGLFLANSSQLNKPGRRAS